MHSDAQALAELAGKTMYERDAASQALGMRGRLPTWRNAMIWEKSSSPAPRIMERSPIRRTMAAAMASAAMRSPKA